MTAKKKLTKPKVSLEQIAQLLLEATEFEEQKNIETFDKNEISKETSMFYEKFEMQLPQRCPLCKNTMYHKEYSLASVPFFIKNPELEKPEIIYLKICSNCFYENLNLLLPQQIQTINPIELPEGITFEDIQDISISDDIK